MAFTLDTFARTVFKRLLGKGHTSGTRDPANEPIFSSFPLSAQTIWASTINPEPTNTSNVGIVSELITLTLEPISGTANSGKYAAYRCKLGAVVPATLQGKINRITGNTYAANDYVGDIIPQAYGVSFRPRLFRGATETPPLDASDWFLDTYSGVVTQEEDNASVMIDYSTTGTLQCYIYIGKFVSEVLLTIGSSFSVQFYDYQTIGAGITGTIDGVNRDFELDHQPLVGSVRVYLNGLLTKDFSITGKIITMGLGSIPKSDVDHTDELFVNYRV